MNNISRILKTARMVRWLYSDEISGRIPMSESSYSITQKEHLKSIYGNYKQVTYKKICESYIKVTFKRIYGIKPYKEWPCAASDSATYFVVVEDGITSTDWRNVRPKEDCFSRQITLGLRSRTHQRFNPCPMVLEGIWYSTSRIRMY
jgi:hypothetical protein